MGKTKQKKSSVPSEKKFNFIIKFRLKHSFLFKKRLVISLTFPLYPSQSLFKIIAQNLFENESIEIKTKSSIIAKELRKIYSFFQNMDRFLSIYIEIEIDIYIDI